MSVSARILTRA